MSENFIELHEETDHQAFARALFASHFGQSSNLWRVIVNPEPGIWYDWADPETGKIGQCCLAESGKWKQAPLGNQPVVLETLDAINGIPRWFRRVRTDGMAEEDAAAQQTKLRTKPSAPQNRPYGGGE